MSRWFRFYADAMRNPKVARLSDGDFRLWCELLCVASEREGKIPPLEDLKHLLKRRLDHLSSAFDRLISGGLMTSLEDGYAPHGWSERQYKSDVSTARVNKHREKRNVSETPPETDTDTDTEKKTPIAPKGVRKPDGVSDEAWSDWRRVRRKPITATVLKRMETEAGKVGWTLAQAVNEAAESGWQGFKAEYIKDRGGGGSRQAPSNSNTLKLTREKLHATGY